MEQQVPERGALQISLSRVCLRRAEEQQMPEGGVMQPCDCSHCCKRPHMV